MILNFTSVRCSHDLYLAGQVYYEQLFGLYLACPDMEAEERDVPLSSTGGM